MDGHTVSARDEADDLVAGQRIAAAGKLDQTVVDAFNDDAFGAFHHLFLCRKLRLSFLLFRLVFLDDLVILFPNFRNDLGQ